MLLLLFIERKEIYPLVATITSNVWKYSIIFSHRFVWFWRVHAGSSTHDASKKTQIFPRFHPIFAAFVSSILGSLSLPLESQAPRSLDHPKVAMSFTFLGISPHLFIGLRNSVRKKQLPYTKQQQKTVPVASRSQVGTTPHPRFQSPLGLFHFWWRIPVNLHLGLLLGGGGRPNVQVFVLILLSVTRFKGAPDSQLGEGFSRGFHLWKLRPTVPPKSNKYI